MPNWCENTLTVSGTEADVKKFMEAAKTDEEPLSLAKIVPEPDYEQVKVKPAFSGLDKSEFVDPKSAWWDWRLQNWGTKWDVGDVMMDEWGDGVEYRFDTAWSPPSEWLERASKKFPELEFRLKYDEPGMCFMGAATAKAGDMSDQTVDYS